MEEATSTKDKIMELSELMHEKKPLRQSVSLDPLRFRQDMMAQEGEGLAKFRSMPDLGTDLRDHLRSVLYAELPFTAVPGMSTATRRVVRNLSVSIDFGDDRQLADFLCECQAKRKGISVKSYYGKGDKVEDALGQDALTVPLLWSAASACVSQFLFGYNTSVMNAPESVVFPGHSSFAWAAAVAAFALGGPLGAAMGGYAANQKGRKMALGIDSFLFILGGLMTTFAPSMLWLTIGRFVVGAASGFSTALVPVYLGELAPPVLRGTFGTVAQMGLVTGILAADVVSFSLRSENLFLKDNWRLVFAVSPFLALCQFFSLIKVVESPRWLLDKFGAGSVRARKALSLLRDLGDQPRELECEVAFIIEANTMHKSLPESESSLDSHQASQVLKLFTNPEVCPVLLVCIFYHLAQQLCGINAVFYYSALFFEGQVDDPLVATVLVGLVNVFAVYGALVLMDFCGRRTLLIWSTGGMFLCVVVLTLTLLGSPLFQPRSFFGIASVALFVAFFELGLGPIAWLIVPEMFEARDVDAAQSVACQVNWLSNFVIGLIFPFMNSTLGPYAFAPFGIVCGLAFFVSIFKLQEVQDTNQKRLQARKHTQANLSKKKGNYSSLTILENDDDDDDANDFDNNKHQG